MNIAAAEEKNGYGFGGERGCFHGGGWRDRLEIARAFVREGAKVHVCDVDQAAIAALAAKDPA